MNKLLLAAIITFSIHGNAKQMICTKYESGGGEPQSTETKSASTKDPVFMSLQSKYDSRIVFHGYYDKEHKMIGAHINDNSFGTSSGSYADYSKEKPYVKVNYRKQTPQGMYLYVLECLEK
jgi:hypothetical protein